MHFRSRPGNTFATVWADTLTHKVLGCALHIFRTLVSLVQEVLELPLFHRLRHHAPPPTKSQMAIGQSSIWRFGGVFRASCPLFRSFSKVIVTLYISCMVGAVNRSSVEYRRFIMDLKTPPSFCRNETLHKYFQPERCAHIAIVSCHVRPCLAHELGTLTVVLIHGGNPDYCE